jgi:hypothetical protein
VVSFFDGVQHALNDDLLADGQLLGGIVPGLAQLGVDRFDELKGLQAVELLPALCVMQGRILVILKIDRRRVEDVWHIHDEPTEYVVHHVLNHGVLERQLKIHGQGSRVFHRGAQEIESAVQIGLIDAGGRCFLPSASM